MTREICIGTRGSTLALWQANWVRQQLERHHPGYSFEVVKLSTRGDKILEMGLAKIGDKGLFTKEIEVALREGQVDIAVHSLKDLPTVLPAGLTIGAITLRAEPGDVLISAGGETLATLPPGALIGTSSLRRQAQLRYYRPDFKLSDLRGNLPTRLAKLKAGVVEAIILAAAGVERLGWGARISERIPYTVCLPAVGQGALCLEVRAGDRRVLRLVQPIHDPQTATAVTAERSLLKALEGGCQVPVGALGRVRGNQLHLEAMVASLNGSQIIRMSITGDRSAAAELGEKLAQALLAAGAAAILDEIRSKNRRS
jgi:hydroxymethylbilane synthase